MKRIRPLLLALTLCLGIAGTIGVRDSQPAAAISPYYDHNAREGSIVRLYSSYFLRGPDQDGFNYWTMMSISGWDLRRISQVFAESQEFKNRYGSLDTPGFVSLVYWNVLNRSVDRPGADYWQGRLGGGMSRGEMMAYFSDSAEYRQRTITSIAPGWRAGSNAAALLGELRVATERPTGFDPDLFPHWDDMDHDGCDTRCEVLQSEKRRDGTWYSLWDGKTMTSASQPEIDHVVSLAEAWDSGAYGWTPTQRDWFADWQTNLTAVTSSANQAHSGRDAAEWVPPLAGARCAFAEIIVTTKFTWNLAVDTAEKAALGRLLTGCTSGSTVIPPVA
ncbi:MAG TPA: DUF4214 domain-containing protein [Acidimicrobiales bacterium]|nr:DUF4214 domain-containing protein [Acidimicrobiales bacterium]